MSDIETRLRGLEARMTECERSLGEASMEIGNCKTDYRGLDERPQQFENQTKIRTAVKDLALRNARDAEDLLDKLRGNVDRFVEWVYNECPNPVEIHAICKKLRDLGLLVPGGAGGAAHPPTDLDPSSEE